jgi:hypothetical protein
MHETKFEILGSKSRKPGTSDLEPPSVTLFPPVSLVSRESDIRDCSKHVHEYCPLVSMPKFPETDLREFAMLRAFVYPHSHQRRCR